MSQTTKGSFVEAWTNTIVGLTINIAVNMLVLPLFGLDVTWGTSISLSLCFTAISLVRSYVLRRIFNRLKWGNK